MHTPDPAPQALTADAPVVELLVKDQYGRQTYHPVSTAAHHFAAIAGTKTLTMHVINHVLALGFTVTYVRDSHPMELTPCP